MARANLMAVLALGALVAGTTASGQNAGVHVPLDPVVTIWLGDDGGTIGPSAQGEVLVPPASRLTLTLQPADGPLTDHDLIRIADKYAGLACVEGLDVSAAGTVTDWSPLARFAAVETLSLPARSSGALRHLSGLTSLRSLTLTGRETTDDDLALVGALGSLRSLETRADRATAEGLAHLAGLRQLETLTLRGVRADGAGPGLSALAEMAGLRRLVLCANPLDDRTMDCVSGLTQLTALDLLGEQPTQWSPERGSYAETAVTDAGTAALEGLRDLEHLVVFPANITDTGLAHLAGPSHLHELCLWGATLSDASVPALAGMTELAELALPHAVLTDEGAERLAASLPRLAALDLNRSPLTDRGLVALARFDGLRTLKLGSSDLSDAGVASLGARGDLTLLVLAGRGITDASVETLNELRDPIHLGLFNTSLTASGEEHLEADRPVGTVSISPGLPRSTEVPPGI